MHRTVMFMMNQKMYKSLASTSFVKAAGRPAALALSALLGLVLAACSSTKSPAPIETRTPQQSIPGPKADPGRRMEVPAAGVSTAPATPSAGATSPKTGSGAESGAVKPGSVESRPLGPAPAVVTGPAGASAPVTAAPPVKSGPKGGKRPYSDAALAELKSSDVPASASPGPAPAQGAAPAAPAGPSAATPSSGDAKPAPNGTFAWPSRGKISAGYSEPKHMGLSFDGQMGDPVLAAGDGKVIHSAVGPRGFGNLIIVKHDGELLTVYANNKALLVKEGQAVKKGQKIAELGDSGTDRPKLYFEIRRQGKPVDPKQFLPSR